MATQLEIEYALMGVNGNMGMMGMGSGQANSLI